MTELPGFLAQQLDHGIHKPLFQIIPITKTTSTPLNTTLITRLREQRNKAIRSYVPQDIDARAVSPWLLTTGWHLHVQPFPVAELQRLVESPRKNDPLYKLSNAIDMLFERGLTLLDQTPELILQKLNSPDPQKKG